MHSPIITQHIKLLRTIVCLAAIVACRPNANEKTPPVVPIVNSTPPTVVWESYSQPQAVVIIDGTAGDAEQPVSTLLVVIDSEDEGELWRGNPRSDGLFTWTQPAADGTYRLLAGSHQVTVSVTDSTDQVIQQTKTVEVLPINNSTNFDTGDTGDTAEDGDSGE